MYRNERAVLSERAEAARLALVEIDAERATRARELASLESRLATDRVSPLWPRIRPALGALALVVAGAALLMQTARLELVSSSTSTAVQLYVGKEAPRLHAAYE